jgi:hypothetical protein
MRSAWAILGFLGIMPDAARPARPCPFEDGVVSNCEPLSLRIPEAQRISGLSRSELYRKASRGEIRLLKSGRSTLVDFASLKRLIGNLPVANIK